MTHGAGYGEVPQAEGLDVMEMFAGSHRIYSAGLDSGLKGTAFDATCLAISMLPQLDLFRLPCLCCSMLQPIARSPGGVQRE